ncbi:MULTISPECIES: reverse transcriptase domain-containing protein [Lysinibacillus]|uniref:reverse transcriptase/maturase family protein n=1 Tax=Lysinibacillus TaxID=400634 RepID=UPI002162D95A|nr:reverse transcriptase domain-containing protein [Lysinibacillus boronitolerans]MCS1394150.1 reverse transcriptase domain-containing protein [Lysinibacillus boronitolerans]
MRNPLSVLDSLNDKDEKYVYHRLYRNLFNREFFLMAYNNIYAKEGNMTKGSDENTIDGMSMARIDKIIDTLKDESYQPQPAKRVYIPKKNGKKRPLGIPSIDDKLVQEVVRLILESIYDNKFSDRSHGFRPNRSCHTALKQFKSLGTGAKWWIEGDIEGFFDNIDHHTLINILREKIKDEKFIRLIYKFLRAGYLEEWKYHKTISGTPQGGIISPILANIYLDKLDRYIEEYKLKFDRGKQRRKNKEYKLADQRVYRARKKYEELKDTLSQEEKEQCIKRIKELRAEQYRVPNTDPFDESFKRIQYVRYADDFLIGVIGSKQDAENIKQDLTNFLREKLNLNLSAEKTLITHASNFAKFLGYEIRIGKNDNRSKDANGVSKRRYNNAVNLTMPKEAWIGKLFELKAIVYTKDNTQFRAMHRASLLNNDDLEILLTYNAEIRGLYNYYKLASDVHMLNDFRYWMKWSMLKTYANKYKTNAKDIAKKFNKNGRFGISYTNKKGIERTIYFYDDPLVKSSEIESYKVDEIPNTIKYKGRTNLIDRLEANKCEWCKTKGVPLEIHHIRKLKDLKGKTKWERFMIERNRKTIALCHDCHNDLHNGKLD